MNFLIINYFLNFIALQPFLQIVIILSSSSVRHATAITSIALTFITKKLWSEASTKKSPILSFVNILDLLGSYPSFFLLRNAVSRLNFDLYLLKLWNSVANCKISRIISYIYKLSFHNTLHFLKLGGCGFAKSYFCVLLYLILSFHTIFS